jgi:porin
MDRWGIGYFKYFLSDDLIDGLDLIGFGYGDEQGVELFYNWAVTPWFRLTADLQWIDPHITEKKDAWIAGLSAQIRF